MGIGRFVYTPILPFMDEALGLTKAHGGLIAPANYLGYWIGALAASLMALPGGRRNWILGALGLSVLVINPPAILLSAVLLGGTFAGITALGLVKARQLSKGDPRRDLGFMTAAFALGQIIGPSFAGYAHGIDDSFLTPSLAAAAALAVAAGLSMIGSTSKD